MRSLVPRLVALLVALLAASAAAQPASPGHPAPDPGLETFLTGPDGTSWAGLRGQPIVLEFFATWCGPCVAVAPHLSALNDSLGGRVAFVTVTEEPAEVVEPFLRRRPLGGLVALDPDGSAREAYGVLGIPQAALIDAEGRFLGLVAPQHLRAGQLDSLAAGRLRPLPAASRGGFSALRDSLMAAGRQRPDWVRGETHTEAWWGEPGERGGMRGNTNEGWMESTGLPLRMLVLNLWAPRTEGRLRMRWDLVQGDSVLLRRPVHLRAEHPGLPADAFHAQIRADLQSALGVTVTEEVRAETAFALRRLAGAEVTLQPDTGEYHASSADGVISVTRSTLPQIASSLAGYLDRDVQDETGLAGTYRLLLLFDDGATPDATAAALSAALRQQAGLELVPVPSETTFYRVRLVE